MSHFVRPLQLRRFCAVRSNVRLGRVNKEMIFTAQDEEATENRFQSCLDQAKILGSLAASAIESVKEDRLLTQAADAGVVLISHPMCACACRCFVGSQDSKQSCKKRYGFLSRLLGRLLFLPRKILAFCDFRFNRPNV